MSDEKKCELLIKSAYKFLIGRREVMSVKNGRRRRKIA
jgi:hypothetical protein